MAQYIALAASAISIISPGLKKNGDGSSSTTRANNTTNSSGGSSLSFSSGIVIGASIGAILISQFQKRRIKERMRYFLRTWLNQEDEMISGGNNKNGGSAQELSTDGTLFTGECFAPPGKLGVAIDTVNNQPVVHRVLDKSPLSGVLRRSDVIIAVDDEKTSSMSAADVTTLMEKKMDHKRKITYLRGKAGAHLGEESIMQIIANCNNSLTPNLHCSKITLKKGTRTVEQMSMGVEVYYVLHGTAEFILNKDTNKSLIGVNETILVNPWISRSISNNNNDDLVFLRISDAGDAESRNNTHVFVVEKIDEQMTMETIANGIKESARKSMKKLRFVTSLISKDQSLN